MSSYIISLIKFTDHPKDFIDGKLFCNTWEYFDKLGKEGIGDSSELTESILSTEVEVPMLNRRYSFRLVNNDSRYTPVFCMYAFYSKKYILPPILKLSDSLIEDLGKYKSAVIVADVKEFIRRINLHFPEFCYSEMKYVEHCNQSGKTIYNPIINNKDRGLYGHQQEFRFYNSKVAITRDNDFDIPGITRIPGTYYGDVLAEKFSTESMQDIVYEIRTAQMFEGVSLDLIIDWNYCHKNNLVKEYQLPG